MQTRTRDTQSNLFDPAILLPAAGQALKKLDPRLMIRNPVMFVVEVVAALTTVIFLRDLATMGTDLGFTFQIILWLWITLLFANFAEAVAEGRGKAQAATLRRARTETMAHRVTVAGTEEVAAAALQQGDIVMVAAGELIPSDGEVIDGIASIDEVRHHRGISAGDP